MMKIKSTILSIVLIVSVTSLMEAQIQTSQSDTATIRSLYEQGQIALLQEDWYTAAEAFLEVLKINPVHRESIAALAECYYQLREFDQALAWVRKARSLDRTSMNLANLEAFTLIALGKLDAAQSIVSEVLNQEPYNKEALFAAAELELAKGKPGQAVQKYQEAVRRYPDDRRALLSLALVLGSLGSTDEARNYAKRAITYHPDDYRTYYYSAYLDYLAGQFNSAANLLQKALLLKPSFIPAKILSGSVNYRLGQFEQTVYIANQIIESDRNTMAAWYLKGMALARLGNSADARSILSMGLTVNSADEFIRIALEDIVLNTTPVESVERINLAKWHFDRARSYMTQNLSDQAIFEYRRGLRINPYATDRREYAELLRIQGFPERHLEELKFIQSLGKADMAIQDAIETYDSLLIDALYRQWQVDPLTLDSRHWKIAVCSLSNQSSFNHVDAGPLVAGYIQDLFIHDNSIAIIPIDPRQASFSTAFRTAREAGADYFLIIKVTENNQELAIQGDMYVGRTGSQATSFAVTRMGIDRLRDGAQLLVDKVQMALPFRATLIQRKASLGLLDQGKVQGVKKGITYQILKKGSITIQNEGIGISYNPQDVVGNFVVDNVDEFVSQGTLTRVGFFDRITTGDEVFLIPENETKASVPEEVVVDPELRELLRGLR